VATLEQLEQLRALEDWWSPSEAGRELETSGQWITHLARTHQIKGVKTSLGWLVDPEDVKELAKAKKRKKSREAKTKRKKKLQYA
jgi:hypothetical protein